jgi:glycosyltransferase involved in cell wall biosynthesis
VIEKKILNIGYWVPWDYFESMMANDSAPQYQGMKVIHQQVAGIEKHILENIDLISVCPASDFPHNDNLFVPFKRFKRGVSYSISLPYINLIFLKHITRSLSLVISTSVWAFRHISARKIVYIYALHSPFLVAGLILKFLFKCKVVVMVPDMHSYMNGNIKLPWLKRFLKYFDSLIIDIVAKNFDGFVVNTTFAQKAFSRYAPTCLIEGLIDDKFKVLSSLLEVNFSKKTIMYSGRLEDMANLLIAFSEIPEDIHLVITGRGIDEDLVLDSQKCDPRIKYLGMLPDDQFREALALADAFINPQDPLTPFVEYSFPSKTLEYMSCVRPVLSTRLPGIPSAYFDYLIPIDDPSSEGIKDAILNWLHTDISHLKERVISGAHFLANNKVASIQTKRLAEFIIE